jgi:glycosyltransferase involved in cell wall biosynthesis
MLHAWKDRSQATTEKVRLLFIGRIPPPTGGITVSFKQLIDSFLDQPKCEVRVLDPSQYEKSGSINRLGLFKILVTEIYRCDYVIASMATGSIATVGLLVMVISKCVGAKLIIRKGGGTDFFAANRLVAGMSKVVLSNAYVYLAQTKRLVDIAKKNGIQSVQWFPTLRRRNPTASANSERFKQDGGVRFVFLGHVKATKGVDQILEVARTMPGDTVIDVYGPLVDGYPRSKLDSAPGVTYKGEVANRSVYEILLDYDCLLLPTFHEGEGYPGVIVEAMMCGLAVITTSWLEIPELVDNKMAILVEPRNAVALREAMMRLKEEDGLLAAMKAASLRRSEEYSLERWTQAFTENYLLQRRL